MKLWSAILAAVLTATMLLSGAPAEAKRLGGGGSVGKQSSNVTQRQASPPANQAAPAPAAPAATPKKPA